MNFQQWLKALMLISCAGLLNPVSAACGEQGGTCQTPGQAGPEVLIPWMANTLPSMSSNMNNMGIPGNWMSLQWMMMMSNHFMSQSMDELTRFGILDAMMRAASTELLQGMMGGANQGNLMMPSQSKRNLPPNTVSGQLSDEAKRNVFQGLMALNPLSMRDMISIMADKMPVADDVSFDDAIESMKLRANEINFKFVGHSPLSKDVEAITGEATPRVEIFSFCDAVVARKILDYAPEFVVFLPCRIALIEDADAKVWVMTLDWNVKWLDLAQNPNSILDDDLRSEAIRIRDGIRYIMEGAATGDF
jgi:uncharacterized protein (DUF302 family)